MRRIKMGDETTFLKSGESRIEMKINSEKLSESHKTAIEKPFAYLFLPTHKFTKRKKPKNENPA